MTKVPAEVDYQNPQKPQTVFPELAKFWLENDCSLAGLTEACYLKTKAVVLRMAQRIDTLNQRLYLSNVAVKQLVGNLNAVVDEVQSIKAKTKNKE